MVEKVLERLQDPEAGGITNMMYADLQKFVDKAEEPTLGKAFLTFLLGHPKSNVFGQFSFPMGQEAHREHASTARVALSMLVCLNATRAIDLRLLYLRRPAADEVHPLSLYSRSQLPYARTAVHSPRKLNQRLTL
jgi:hypothetical protein